MPKNIALYVNLPNPNDSRYNNLSVKFTKEDIKSTASKTHVDAEVGIKYGWFGFNAKNTTTDSSTQLDEVFSSYSITAKYILGTF
jgi:hypothetical protein